MNMTQVSICNKMTVKVYYRLQLDQCAHQLENHELLQLTSVEALKDNQYLQISTNPQYIQAIRSAQATN